MSQEIVNVNAHNYMFSNEENTFVMVTAGVRVALDKDWVMNFFADASNRLKYALKATPKVGHGATTPYEYEFISQAVANEANAIEETSNVIPFNKKRAA